MHERKQAFTDLSDGFVTIPGGTGTMDELWEALSWAQLGYHAKPVGLLNVAGYYDGLVEFWEKMGEVGFLRAQHRGLLLVDTDLDGLLDTDGEPRADRVADHVDARRRICERPSLPRRDRRDGARIDRAAAPRVSRWRAKLFDRRYARAGVAALCLVPALRRYRRRAGPRPRAARGDRSGGAGWPKSPTRPRRRWRANGSATRRSMRCGSSRRKPTCRTRGRAT